MGFSILPQLAPFPQAAWRTHIAPEEWKACLSAWLSLLESHLSLKDPEFAEISAKDESLVNFLKSFNAEMSAVHSDSLIIGSPELKKLREKAFILCARLQGLQSAPSLLLQWQFLADLSRHYGKIRASTLLSFVWSHHSDSIEASLASIKAFLIKQFDADISGDLKTVESKLRHLNSLLYISPDAAAFFYGWN
ncbi:hypothetical protein B7463_g5355, partial [Scytalidium lignicola]